MLTAKASHSQMGKPLSHDLQVPRYARRTYNHKIAWSHAHNKTADMFNSIVESYEKPCWRRYLEYLGFSPSTFTLYQYITTFPPPPIKPKPERIWTLIVDGTPVSCFTNVVEAWLVMIGLNKFGSIWDTHLIYQELS
jgi:hypothetical protein